MFCPKCGTQLPDGSRFCDHCGARLGSEEPSSRPEKSSGKKSWLPAAAGLVLIAVIGIFVSKYVLGQLTGEDEPAESRREAVTESPTPYPSSGAVSAESSGTEEAEWDEKWLLGEGMTEEKWYGESSMSRTEDFLWFYNHEENTVNAEIPEAAEIIEDPGLLSGEWKCLIVRKPLSSPHREYWNLELSFSGSDVTCTQFWSGKAEGAGEFEDASSANSNPLAGTIDENGIMDLTDSFDNTFSIVEWYSYAGRQYGLGTYECVWDGEDSMGFAAVCRP